MDQRITFQRTVETADGAGGTTRTWANFATNPDVWAQVTARPGIEAMNNGRMTASAPLTFTIRNRADVTPLDRIVWNGMAFNIRSILRMSGRDLTLQIDTDGGAAQ